MRPQDVKPGNFKEHTIIHSDEWFAVAYGIWEDGKPRLAMRWNGEGEGDKGYPKAFGNPMWFQLPDYGIWTSELLKAVETIKAYDGKIAELDAELDRQKSEIAADI